jgi:hypothetical protein
VLIELPYLMAHLTPEKLRGLTMVGKSGRYGWELSLNNDGENPKIHRLTLGCKQRWFFTAITLPHATAILALCVDWGSYLEFTKYSVVD